MNDSNKEALVRVARLYYPEGFPPEKDRHDEPELACQRTPEYHRWQTAWDEAMSWTQWDAFLDETQSLFPNHDFSDVTQPRMSACRRCCIYLRQPLSLGSRLVTRVAAAVSILAPLYLVYVTRTTVQPDKSSTRAQRISEPSGEACVIADALASRIEATFGHGPFPMELAGVPLQGLRVYHLTREYKHPTLLNALLSEDLDNLP